MTKEVDSVALEVEQLMADYPSVVNSSKKLPKARHQVKHVIETTGHPVFAKALLLDPDKLHTTKDEFFFLWYFFFISPKGGPTVYCICTKDHNA